MTANQIANSATLESIRHNQASESETQRHNQEVERLTDKELEYTKEYNQQKMALEKQISDLNREYQYASLERQSEIQSERNNIEHQLGILDYNYKTEMNIINSSKVGSENAFREFQKENQGKLYELEAKRSYYENQKTESVTAYNYAMIENAKTKLKQDQDRIDNEWALGIINSEQRETQLKLAQREYELKAQQYVEVGKANTKADTMAKRSQAIRNYSGVASDWADAILPF